MPWRQSSSIPYPVPMLTKLASSGVTRISKGPSGASGKAMVEPARSRVPAMVSWRHSGRPSQSWGRSGSDHTRTASSSSRRPSGFSWHM